VTDRRTSQRALIARNHWRAAPALDGPASEWAELSVSVIIAAYEAAATLPLVLAALTRQDYPSHLIDVVVVDDNSTTPVVLPEVRPDRTRLIVSPADGWGAAHARQAGVDVSTGDVVLFLDADMVVFDDHITEHLRLHHRLHDAVVIGHKRFAEQWQHLSVDDVMSGDPAMLFGDAPLPESQWLTDAFDATDQLDRADFKVGRYFTTASGSVGRALFEEAGGFDTSLRLGEDTELGFRLANVGGVLIPMTTSSSWHLGASTGQSDDGASVRWNTAFLAQRIPFRRLGPVRRGRTWQVPLVRIVLDTAGSDPESIKASVAAWLNGTEDDVVVDVVGPWPAQRSDRRSVLTDPDVEWQVLAEWFRGDARVRLLDAAPDRVAPAVFRVDADPSVRIGRDGLTGLLKAINASPSFGWLTATLAEGTVTVTRTAADHRARRAIARGMPADQARAAVWGEHLHVAAAEGLADGPPPSAWTKARRRVSGLRPARDG
jgi:GT2 family glycosyltransferase